MGWERVLSRLLGWAAGEKKMGKRREKEKGLGWAEKKGQREGIVFFLFEIKRFKQIHLNLNLENFNSTEHSQ